MVASFFSVTLGFEPLPPFLNAALADVEVETSIEGASMFRLHFDLSRDKSGDFDALAPDLFRPLAPVKIGVSFGLSPPLTLINGYVRDVSLTVGDEGGGTRLEVTGADAFGTLMGHVQVPIPWPNMPDSAIVALLFGKYGVIPAVLPTPPTRTILDTVTTQATRDSQFLRQIADFHGYHLFIQPDPVSGLDFGRFQPLSLMLAMPPQGVLSVDFGSATNLSKFAVRNAMLKPTTKVGVFTDAVTRVPIPVIAPVAAEPPMGREPSLFRILPPPLEVELSMDAANVAEAYLKAIAAVTESARTVSASGEVDGVKFARPLLPGLPVMVRGAGGQHSGQYLVTSVSHRLSRDGYTQSFQAMRNAVGVMGSFLDPLAPVR
jgi:hypothetical protein